MLDFYNKRKFGYEEKDNGYQSKVTNTLNSSDRDKTAEDSETKLSKMLDSGNPKQFNINPFLDSDGNVFNKFVNYQKLLDSSGIGDSAKRMISEATGLAPTQKENKIQYASYAKNNDFTDFNPDADENNLASLDVTTELPKLNVEQISSIITSHFSKSPVIKASDAQGIFEAQQKSGMSALAILGIGALESGYGTSNIAKNKNNLWGWGASNSNPAGNAKSFSPISQGALEFANSYIKTYYNGYGAKSIQSAGTGDNAAGKGYAYNNDGSINSSWASSIGSIMKNFYQTAKNAYKPSVNNTSAIKSSNAIVTSAGKYVGTPYVWGGESYEEGGMDCSGFVYNALKDAGYNVGRTTAQGYRGYGTKVGANNLQAGDLIFYGKNGKATHIAIYIGNGQIIHSSGGSKNTKNNPGKGVNITTLNHRSDFIEARRI